MFSLSNVLPWLLLARATIAMPVLEEGPTFNLTARQTPDKTDYTIDEIISLFQTSSAPATDTCVFYHGDFYVNAIEFSAIYGTGYTTLYDVYPTDKNVFDSTADPQRAYAVRSIKRQWFKDTSRAYAKRCTGKVYLLWDKVQPFRKPAGNGFTAWTAIWLTDELPQLRLRGITDGDITIVNPYNFHDQTSYNGPNVKRFEDDSEVPEHLLTKRDHGASPPDGRVSVRCILSRTCAAKVRHVFQNYPNVEGSVFTWDQDGNMYTPGDRCGFHVVQHQKPDPSKDSYTYDVTIKDGDNNVIGGVTGLVSATGQTRDISSRLPFQLELTSGGVDADPVTFSYAGDTFKSDSGRCGVGKYDSGSRQMDCGFPC